MPNIPRPTRRAQPAHRPSALACRLGDVRQCGIEIAFHEEVGQTVLTITCTLPEQATRDHIVEGVGMLEGFAASHVHLEGLLAEV